jgi:AraC family transcriptional regulator
MVHLNAICRALDFVEANLTNEIAVADMAAAASYSLYHFCRTFNRVVHHTPYDYLMRRRLSESARQLLKTDRRIIDIAFEYQFNNPETFSRAFKRMFGVQPSQWKGGNGSGYPRLLPRLTREYLQHINQGSLLTPSLRELGPLRLIGVMTLTRRLPAVVPELWEALARQLERAGIAPATRHAYGITWFPEGWEARGLLHMTAVEAPLDPAESALVVKTLAAQRCACFTHRGSRRDLAHSLDYIHRTWLPRSGERLASSMLIERHTAGWEGCQEAETEFEWQLYIPIA